MTSKGSFHQSFMVPGESRINAQTGKEICLPRGPFSVTEISCAHNPLTEAEIVEHVVERFGVEPLEIETLCNGKVVPHPTVSTKAEREEQIRLNEEARGRVVTFIAVDGEFAEENRPLPEPHPRVRFLSTRPESFIESARLRRAEGGLTSALHNVSMAEGIATAHLEMTGGECRRSRIILKEAMILRGEIEEEMTRKEFRVG